MSNLSKNMKNVNAKLDELDAKIERISKSLERNPSLTATSVVRYDKRQQWKDSVYDRTDKVIERSHRKGRLVVLQDVYAKMAAEQGISWDREVATYSQVCHVSKPTILDVIYDSPSFRSQFNETLNGMMEIDLTVDEIIEPLAQKYHDHSTSNMITWKRVYRAMDQKQHINWLMYAVKLMDVDFSRPVVTKKELIVANKELKEEFFYAVKELMAA